MTTIARDAPLRTRQREIEQIIHGRINQIDFSTASIEMVAASETGTLADALSEDNINIFPPAEIQGLTVTQSGNNVADDWIVNTTDLSFTYKGNALYVQLYAEVSVSPAYSSQTTLKLKLYQKDENEIEWTAIPGAVNGYARCDTLHQRMVTQIQAYVITGLKPRREFAIRFVNPTADTLTVKMFKFLFEARPIDIDATEHRRIGAQT